jgi:hypothetical protein
MTDIDAWDFQQKLNQDPEYQKKMAAKAESKEKRAVEINEIEREFIKEWKLNGFFDIETTGDFLGFKKKLNPTLTNFILTWIPRLNNKHGSQERLVRGLVLAEKPYEGKILITLFDDPESSFFLRWAIGNTIATGKPQGVTDWLKRKFMALKLGKENEMLVYAIARYFDYPEAVDLLKKIFDHYPMHAAETLQAIGGENELEFLKEKLKNYKGGAIKATIAKAIKKIARKHEEQ